MPYDDQLYIPGSVEDQDQEYGGATKSSKLDDYKKFLEEMGKKNREDSEAQKRRMALLEKETSKSARDRAAEIFSDMNKNRYGFRPDSTGKRIAAEVIDSIMGRVGFGMSQQAYKLGEQDYDNKTKGYKDLLSGELANQNAINKQSQFDLAEKLKVVQEEEKVRKTKEAEKLAKDKFGLDSDKFDWQKTLGEHKMKYDEVMMALKSTDEETKRYALDNLKKLDSINPMLSSVMQMKPDQMAIVLPMLIKEGKISVDDVNNSFKYLNERTKATTKQSDTSLGTVTTPGTVSVDENGNILKGTSTRMKIPGQTNAPYQPNFQLTPGADITKPLLEQIQKPRDPIAEITAGPKAKQLAQVITNPKPIPTGNSLKDAETYYNLSKTAKKYEGIGGNDPIQAKDRVKKIDQWTETTAMLHQLADNAGSQLANGTLDKFRGAIQQSGPIKAFRAINGMDSPEINQDTQSLFAQANHLKTRFQTGRPAYQMIKNLEDAVNNKLDSPEAYFKRQAAVAIIAELTTKMDSNPNFKRAFEKLDEHFAKNGGKGGSWAEATNNVLDEAAKNARKGQYKRVTVDNIFQSALGSLKGKSNTPEKESLKNWILNNANQD